MATDSIVCNEHGSPALCYVRDDGSHAISHSWRWKGDFSIPVSGNHIATLVGIYVCVICEEVFVGAKSGRLAPVDVPTDSAELLEPPLKADCPRDEREYCEGCDVVLNQETGNIYNDDGSVCYECLTAD